MNTGVGQDRIKRFVVPDLGEGLQEVTVTAWQVAVGEDVELNQPLCSVETAKAEVEIPSPYAGRIVEIGGAPGEVLDVGALLVSIEIAAGAPVLEAERAGPARLVEPAEPAGRRPVLVGYGTDDAFDASRRPPPGGADGRRPKAKPAVRKLAAELGVELATVPPGPDGVITRDGVLAAAGRAPAPADSAAPAAPADPGDEVLAVRGVQAAMAKQMMVAHNTIPDASASLQVDGTNLLRLRDRLRADTATGAVVTPFVLTLRLVVLALTHHKILNCTWVDTAAGPQLHQHRAVHLGFAVAAPRGLLVPVIRGAQDKTTRELAEEVARLIGAARAGTAAPADLRGSTFTVSNYGALGVDAGVPVINPPEAAILGIGALRRRPAVVDDAVVIRPQATLTCVFDHRIVDGAQAAGFLRELQTLIETPAIALAEL